MGGRMYVERGQLVRLIVCGGGRGPKGSKSPRNALLERRDGSRVVRPMRGLRRA